MGMKDLFLIFFLAVCMSAQAQKLYCPGGYMLLNASSEKCKFWSQTTRALSNFDGDKSKFEVVVNLKNLDSVNDSLEQVFRTYFLEADTFPDLRLTVQIKDYDKIDKTKESKTPIKLKGSFTMHGVKKELEFDGNMHYRPKLVILDYVFYVKLDQYDLNPPRDLKNCISPLLQVKGNAQLYALDVE
jgi:hypothetical protein